MALTPEPNVGFQASAEAWLRRVEAIASKDLYGAGVTGYTHGMAKVMISLPDEFLARVDAQANAHGSTRSATIRQLAEVGLGERQRRLAEQMAALEGTAQRHGGTSLRDLKAGRPK